MKKTLLCFIGCFMFLLNLKATTYFISTTGKDANDGLSASKSLYSLQAAVNKAASGDVILIASGNYVVTKTISITKSNLTIKGQFTSASNRPVLNFSSIPRVTSDNSGDRGVELKGSGNTFYGIVIKSATDNGMNVTGSSNRIEFCDFAENQDTGLQLNSGAAKNSIINCDSYYNQNPADGNADGFAPKLDVGTGNYFFGCRAYQNSDDGWDGFMKSYVVPTTTLENCWAFDNGKHKDGSVGSGNGNGFKMGGGFKDGTSTPDKAHNAVLKNCLSFNNMAKGFDQNHNLGSMTLLNCTGINNKGGNYVIAEKLLSGNVLTLKNCIDANSNKPSILASAVQSTNSWNGIATDVSDFVSTTATGVVASRKVDGSLPDIIFMHLKTGSNLIDAGTSVGLPYNGTKPDLGCFETGGTVVAPVNTAPSVSITTPAANAVFTNPTTVVLSATASDKEGSIAKVEFYNGTALLGTSTASPSSFTMNAPAAGTYSITAKAYDQNGASTTSTAISFSVLRTTANNTPKVSITSPLINTTITLGTAVAIAASASDSDGSILKVEFYNGTVLVGTDATSPYSAAFTPSAAGSYSLTAVAIDNLAARTTSASVVIQVTAPPTSTDAIVGATCVKAGQSILLELNSAQLPNATTYSWWYTGSSGSLVASGSKATLSAGQGFGSGEVCVGVNYSVSPWWKQYCKKIDPCAARIGTDQLEVVNSTVSVFPNPSQTSFNLNPRLGAVKATVWNVLGNEVLTLANAEGEFGQNLAIGVYTLKLEFEDGTTELVRLVKQH